MLRTHVLLLSMVQIGLALAKAEPLVEERWNFAKTETMKMENWWRASFPASSTPAEVCDHIIRAALIAHRDMLSKLVEVILPKSYIPNDDMRLALENHIRGIWQGKTQAWFFCGNEPAKKGKKASLNTVFFDPTFMASTVQCVFTPYKSSQPILRDNEKIFFAHQAEFLFKRVLPLWEGFDVKTSGLVVCKDALQNHEDDAVNCRIGGGLQPSAPPSSQNEKYLASTDASWPLVLLHQAKPLSIWHVANDKNEKPLFQQILQVPASVFYSVWEASFIFLLAWCFVTLHNLLMLRFSQRLKIIRV